MRLRAGAALAVTAALVVSAPAFGSRLVTWTTASRFVDPSKVRFNGPTDRPKRLRVNVLLPDGYDGQRRFPVLKLRFHKRGRYRVRAAKSGLRGASAFVRIR